MCPQSWDGSISKLDWTGLDWTGLAWPGQYSPLTSKRAPLLISHGPDQTEDDAQIGIEALEGQPFPEVLISLCRFIFPLPEMS